jgi:hypothetical protein
MSNGLYKRPGPAAFPAGPRGGPRVSGRLAKSLPLPSAALPLQDGQTMQAGVVSANRTYLFESHAFTLATPASIAVSCQLVLHKSEAPKEVSVHKEFHLKRVRRLSLRALDWNL